MTGTLRRLLQYAVAETDEGPPRSWRRQLSALQARRSRAGLAIASDEIDATKARVWNEKTMFIV